MNTTDSVQSTKDVGGADFDETRSVEIVNARWAGDDERLRSVMTSFVSHLHAFVKEIEPTDEEWQRAIGFLTAVGHKCDDTRQEFILLSDMLGVSSLVEAINNRKPQGLPTRRCSDRSTWWTSPPRELGANIAADGVGTPCVVAGTVRSLDGSPLPGALVDVWQANGDGFYDVQQPDPQPEGNLRGLFTADGKGGFWFQR